MSNDLVNRGQSRISDYAEGNLRSAHVTPASPLQAATFLRMVVLDVISDPNQIVDDKKISYWESILKVSNIGLAKAGMLPRNTIIGQILGDKNGSPSFSFPFFPSHLSFPCKAGETVWAMRPDPGAAFSDITYWFCKVTEAHTVDDVNHTHAPRVTDTSFVATLKERSQNGGKTDPVYELRNGQVADIQGDRITDGENQYINGTEDVFENILTSSDAGSLTSYESVPRFRKRPGDIALEGTNNTLIVLGTDRKSAIAEYEPGSGDREQQASIPKFPQTDLIEHAGSIDLVAGRGQVESTYGKDADTTSIKKPAGSKKGPPLKKELLKATDQLSVNEGDFDYASDRSRILISQRTKVDNKFNISSYNEKKNQVRDDDQGDAAIVIKSDKVRLIARSDIVLLVSNFEDATSPDGSKIKKDVTDESNFASITIRKSGDIVFTPAKSGVIKLGGDDASLAVLCEVATGGREDQTSSQSSRLVTASPIIDTMGGSQGLGQPGQGQYATKVLMK